MPVAVLAESLQLRIPLIAVASTPGDGPRPCVRCGSRGLNVHQRTRKRVKDPQVAYALVVRYLCKRCGHVGRSYPAGLGAGRQSASLQHLSVLLYWLGLSYGRVREVLIELGCPLSTTSIRRNVEATRESLTATPPLTRLRLEPRGGGLLRGPDGMLALRLLQPLPSERLLEAEIAPGPGAAELRWRLETCAVWLARIFHPGAYPPGSA